MPDRSARRASFDSAPDHSRTLRDQPPTPRQYQTFSPASFWSRDVAQDRHINGMMEFGRRRLVVSRSPNEVEQSVTNRSDAASTQYHSARSSQGAASSLRESPRHTETSFETAFEESATVRITLDPPLRLLALYSGNERASTLPARGARNLARSRPLRPSSPSITTAEAFYRSSRPQIASVEERRTTVRLHRPSTPYPGNIPPVPSRPARPYATFPLPSSQRQEYIDDPVLSYEPPSPNKRPPQPIRLPPSPPLCPKRLPADYRAKTSFSFNREPTPTPFETKDARAMTPSHPLYNAPRTGGVDLELRAMGRSLGRNGAKLHRTMWPEEIEEMAENVSDMVTNLVRTSGAVRDGEPEVVGVVEQKAEEEKTSKLDEVGEPKVDKKKGKFKWLKKLLVKKKKQMTEPKKIVLRNERYWKLIPNRRHLDSQAMLNHKHSGTIGDTSPARLLSPIPLQLPPTPRPQNHHKMNPLATQPRNPLAPPSADNYPENKPGGTSVSLAPTIACQKQKCSKEQRDTYANRKYTGVSQDREYP
jgi:hypothetical protein